MTKDEVIDDLEELEILLEHPASWRLQSFLEALGLAIEFLEKSKSVDSDILNKVFEK